MCDNDKNLSFYPRREPLPLFSNYVSIQVGPQLYTDTMCNVESKSDIVGSTVTARKALGDLVNSLRQFFYCQIKKVNCM